MSRRTRPRPVKHSPQSLAWAAPPAGRRFALHSLDERLRRRPSRTQRTVSLRVGTQVQALLSSEGRSAGRGRTGDGRGRGACRSGRAGVHGPSTSPQAADAAAVEGDGEPRLRQAHEHAAQGRWRLSHAARPHLAGQGPLQVLRRADPDEPALDAHRQGASASRADRHGPHARAEARPFPKTPSQVAVASPLEPCCVT